MDTVIDVFQWFAKLFWARVWQNWSSYPKYDIPIGKEVKFLVFGQECLKDWLMASYTSGYCSCVIDKDKKYARLGILMSLKLKLILSF